MYVIAYAILIAIASVILYYANSWISMLFEQWMIARKDRRQAKSQFGTDVPPPTMRVLS